MSAAAGRPPGPHGPNAPTIYGRNTAARVHAIVGQILDELERRRVSGRADIVRRACDEIEKMPALDALRALRELLPKDADPAAKAPVQNNVALFVQAARELAERNQRPDALAPGASAPTTSLLELVAQPVSHAEPASTRADAEDIEW